MNTTLDAIYQLGEQMQQALAADDLDTFYNLVDQREDLVGRLSKSAKQEENFKLNPSESQALEDQYKLIIEAINKKEHEMMRQLRNVDQYKKAGKSYRSVKKRPQFINRNLHG